MITIKNFKKPFIAILIAGVSFGLLTDCGKFKSFEKRVEWVANKLTSKLDLDDAQKAKLESIKAELIAKHKVNRPKHDTWITEITSQIRNEKIDTKALDKLHADREAQHLEMRKFFQTKLIEFHAVLKPEQRTKLADLITEFAKKHRPDEE
ncbi:Spy/CpxP family protein refolding chaperone [Leptospira sp. 'Mane']|uniref:Spy/CpxP family protein refolding chaperone n=1 Tax=Leptospira sp. 'Mane' TaxID=3387407 RepID=UPI00398A7633